LAVSATNQLIELLNEDADGWGAGGREIARYSHSLITGDPTAPISMEGAAVVVRAVAMLNNEVQRAALIWRKLGEVSLDDVARLMGCQRSAARQIIHRGERELGEILESLGLVS
jgi:DNA-directed RNA polymerase specialized sigma24 family protein